MSGPRLGALSNNILTEIITYFCWQVRNLLQEQCIHSNVSWFIRYRCRTWTAQVRGVYLSSWILLSLTSSLNTVCILKAARPRLMHRRTELSYVQTPYAWPDDAPFLSLVVPQRLRRAAGIPVPYAWPPRENFRKGEKRRTLIEWPGGKRTRTILPLVKRQRRSTWSADDKRKEETSWSSNIDLENFRTSCWSYGWRRGNGGDQEARWDIIFLSGRRAFKMVREEVDAWIIIHMGSIAVIVTNRTNTL